MTNKENKMPQTWKAACKFLTQSISQHNNKVLKRSYRIFYGSKVPDISISNYVIRIYKYARCSEACIVVALIYIERLLKKNLEMTLDELSVHRLFLSAIILAIKFYDDEYYNNKFYAKMGGVACHDLNKLERKFIRYLDYDLTVKSELFEQYSKDLIERETINASHDNVQ